MRGVSRIADTSTFAVSANTPDLRGGRAIPLVRTSALRHQEPNHRALGTEVLFVYDRNRLASIDYPSKPDVTYVYGAPGAASGRAGRIQQVLDESGAQEHFYGALGEVRRTIRTVAPSDPNASPVVFDLRLTTDSLGRLLRLKYPDGETVTNTYDAGGMLSEVTGVGTGWQKTYANELRYDVFGNRTRLRYGNGVVTTWSYEPARVRLSRVLTTLPSALEVQDLNFTYDAASNPKEIKNLLEPLTNSSTTTQPGSSTLLLTYDGVDRLTRAEGSAQLEFQKTTTYDQNFQYSASHNLLHKSRVHKVIQSSGSEQQPVATNFASAYSYTGGRPHLPNQVGDLVLTYDASGNPTVRNKLGTGSAQNLTWDDDGRLVDFTQGSVNQHNTYDASGLRVRRKSTQRETIFSSPYFDLENNTQGVKHVFAGELRVASALGPFASGTDPVADDVPGEAYYFHTDHLGSTSVLTNDDQLVHQSLEYFVDGETWIDHSPQTPVNGYLINGKPYDPDTGFYDYGQRFYDPRTSLWLGVDPALTDSPTGTIGRPFVLAPIAYAAQSPAALVDPDGRDVPKTAAGKQIFRQTMMQDPFRFQDPAGFNWDTLAASGSVDAHDSIVEATGGKDFIAPEWTWHNDLASVTAGFGDVLTLGWGSGARACWDIETADETSFAYDVGTVGGLAATLFAPIGIRPLRASPTTGGVWSLRPFARGVAIENALGRNLPYNFPVIDRFSGGVATSIKSIDLGAQTYQNVGKLQRTLTRYINAVAAFNGRTWGGAVVDRSSITGRALELAIPASGGNLLQQAVLQAAVQYGQSRGVKVIIIPI